RILAHVTAIHVQVGDSVRAGQRLLDLDAREVQSQLEQAQAGLTESREALVEVEQSLQAAHQARATARAQQELTAATLTRYRALLERHSVAPQEYDEIAARAKVVAAETQRAEALITAITAKKRQVLAKIKQAAATSTSTGVLASYATISAPFDAIVIAKPAEIGRLASPGVPLLEVEARQYLLEVAVAESATHHLLVGQQAHVTVGAATQSSAQPIREIVPTAPGWWRGNE
ncbi:MAG: biotin/lipoyl-binding protein, partial [Deltaproteobacteria bacterium]|nr:biotin/lipoyl-binding protein [Deltaproteobacteria bacterium]